MGETKVAGCCRAAPPPAVAYVNGEESIGEGTVGTVGDSGGSGTITRGGRTTLFRGYIDEEFGAVEGRIAFDEGVGEDR